jgi:hypothetical protein
MTKQYKVVTWHGEVGTAYAVVDTFQPSSEQPAVVHTFSTTADRNARYLAEDFCARHNS